MVVKGTHIQLPPYMNYKNYSVKDFILDESFQKWILHPDEATCSFWESWLKLHPEKQATVEEARNFIKSLGFREELPTRQDFSEVWENIDEAKKQYSLKDSEVAYHPASPRNFSFLYKVAAVFLLFALSAIAYLLRNDSEQHITCTTDYGETRTILLPDSSIVHLNANSTLTYTATWDEEHPREVWLNGEAFFDVQRKVGKTEEIQNDHPDRFMVHTRQLDVIVLGTQFNVNERRGKTKVVLHSGKVKLQTLDKADMMMEPGELAELNPEAGKLVKKIVDTKIYNSWINNQLIFENTPLHEVAATLEDNYGLKIEFAEGIAQERFTGTIPTDNIDIFFTILSESLDVDITSHNDLIKVNYKK